MADRPRNHLSDLRGASRLAIDAIAGITGLVEAMHSNIAAKPTKLGGPIVSGAVNGTASLVYRSVRGVTRAVGGGLDLALGALIPAVGEMESTPARETVVAILNGVLGDHLAETHNPLAIAMRMRRDGKPLTLTREALSAAIPKPTAKLVVLAHGLCMNDLRWARDGQDHGAALAKALGYTAVYLHYNTGLHISTNGRAFADQLETLVAAWPVPLEELTIVAHSMGGLVARSAWHYGTAAGNAWPQKLGKLVFLGTPHHGAPLERGGHWIDTLVGRTPYTAPFTRLGRIRSAGITDLRHGSVHDEDWQGRDRFAHGKDPRQPMPLPEGVRCYAVAATTGRADAPLRDRLIGDGLVPVPSALGQHRDPRLTLVFPESQQWIAYGTSHLDLLARPEVYERIRGWLAA
jgi:pimeloyl-ACP methyl ester carboxylesterase